MKIEKSLPDSASLAASVPGGGILSDCSSALQERGLNLTSPANALGSRNAVLAARHWCIARGSSPS